MVGWRLVERPSDPLVDDAVSPALESEGFADLIWLGREDFHKVGEGEAGSFDLFPRNADRQPQRAWREVTKPVAVAAFYRLDLKEVSHEAPNAKDGAGCRLHDLAGRKWQAVSGCRNGCVRHGHGGCPLR